MPVQMPQAAGPLLLAELVRDDLSNFTTLVVGKARTSLAYAAEVTYERCGARASPQRAEPGSSGARPRPRRRDEDRRARLAPDATRPRRSGAVLQGAEGTAPHGTPRV